jgi:hypothetical protein
MEVVVEHEPGDVGHAERDDRVVEVGVGEVVLGEVEVFHIPW